MTLRDAMIRGIRATLFDVDHGRAEEVEYQRGSELPWSVPVIFQVVSEDDRVEENVYGDSCFFLIHEDFLHSHFDRAPKKDDKIVRSLPLADTQVVREETWYLVGEFQRDSLGVWKCLAQKNIRLYPEY